MPKISIITPAYIDTPRKLSYLNEMIESVISQDLPDWEMILIDDGSPIGLEIPSDIRIRTIRTGEQNGPSRCRNTGVALALSEAILPIDADDVLADTNILSTMYGFWEQDKTNVVYGDLQRYRREENGEGFTKGQIFSLPDYTFDRVMDLNGIIPVTAMHSVECHQKAGGWKTEFNSGLEDVEYWISAGKAGFCGRKIPLLVFLYRQHDESRAYRLRRILRQEKEMRNRIVVMHSDIYEGRYPVGCCGGSKTGYTPNVSQAIGARVSTLDQYQATDKVWVQYKGSRQGTFGIVGPFTNYSYKIQGKDHKFEVHINDLSKIRRLGRGQDFIIGVEAPIEHIPEEEIERDDAEKYVALEPVLAPILTLDQVALDQGQETYDASQSNELDKLGMSNKITQSLIDRQFSLEQIAKLNISELTKISGIGVSRATQIIEKANQLIDY